jgi:RNA polymerase sigma factor (sigma-70 family)
MNKPEQQHDIDDDLHTALDAAIEGEVDTEEAVAEAADEAADEAVAEATAEAIEEGTAPVAEGAKDVDIELLVRANLHRLHNFLRRRVGNTADVDDLVQDTLLEALKCRDKFQGNSRPETWLFGIAMNLVRNHYKRNRVRSIYDDIDIETLGLADVNDPLELVERRQTVERVRQAANQLSEDARILLQLIFEENMSYEEAAEFLNIPIGTVRSRISRARAVLRQYES